MSVEGYAEITDKYHTVVGQIEEYDVCSRCNMRVGETRILDAYAVNHSYNETGRCTECDHENACTHPEEAIENISHKQILAVYGITESTHTFDFWQVEFDECSVCKQTIRVSTLDNRQAETEEHDYEDGVCTVCGFEYVPNEQESNSGSGEPGEQKDPAEPVEPGEPESPSEPVEPGESESPYEPVEPERAPDNRVVAMDETGMIVGDVVNVRSQPSIESVRREQVTEGTAVRVLAEVTLPDGEVWYHVQLADGGKGYIFGELVKLGKVQTAAPTAAPAEPEAEPAYAEAEKTSCGIAATEETAQIDIVKTAQMIAGAVLTKGETAEATIRNIDLVLTEAELAQMAELELSEQLIVSLCAVGFEKQVDAAMADEAAPLTLSDEALALKKAIADRIAAMTGEEKAEFDALIEENFPKSELISYDDKTFESFRLEVEITDGEETVYEAYEFRLEKTKWLLTKVFVEAE